MGIVTQEKKIQRIDKKKIKKEKIKNYTITKSKREQKHDHLVLTMILFCVRGEAQHSRATRVLSPFSASALSTAAAAIVQAARTLEGLLFFSLLASFLAVSLSPSLGEESGEWPSLDMGLGRAPGLFIFFFFGLFLVVFEGWGLG